MEAAWSAVAALAAGERIVAECTVVAVAVIAEAEPARLAADGIAAPALGPVGRIAPPPPVAVAAVVAAAAAAAALVARHCAAAVLVGVHVDTPVKK